MGMTFEVACIDCKKALWVGQDSAGSLPYLYKDDKNITALEKFLFNHRGHKLVFEESNYIFDEVTEQSINADKYLSCLDEDGNEI